MIIRDIRNVEEEDKGIKEMINRNVSNLFEHEEEDYYKPATASNFWSNRYIEYKSKGDRKTLSVEEYLNKIKPFLKDITNYLKKSDTWKIHLTIRINFISSKYDNDEECEMHTKSDNIESKMNHEVDEVIEEIFESLKKDVKISWKNQ